jgi:hypothetical protein
MKQWFRQSAGLAPKVSETSLTRIERSGENEEEREFGKLLE